MRRGDPNNLWRFSDLFILPLATLLAGAFFTFKKGAVMSDGPLWDASTYNQFGRFVSDHGDVILSWLDAKPGERILDAGCGDGVLTLKIAALGALVEGVELAPKMVAASRKAGLEVREMNLCALEDAGLYEAVFSNAVLHWIADWRDLLARFHRALKPQGRLVVECGGFGNIAAIRTTVSAVALKLDVPTQAGAEVYLTPQKAKVLLEEAGFDVVRIELCPRQTHLPAGMAGWLSVFREPFLSQFSNISQRDEVIEGLLALLQGALQTDEGEWYADYVRLRFEARKL